MDHRAPPPLPGIRIEAVEDYTARSRCDEGYLRVRRRKVQARYRQETQPSEPFAYDVLERWCPDAVAMLLHFDRDGERFILLRSCVRPPLALRPEPFLHGPVPLPPGAEQGELWEIPAGIVEAREQNEAGLQQCAAREVLEETGVTLPAEALRPLGGVLLPSAGSMGECIYLFEADIGAAPREQPHGDGPLERHGCTIEVPLRHALAWCDAGLLPDGKTELALRRFAARLPAGSLP